jgi:hypothetical protein
MHRIGRWLAGEVVNNTVGIKIVGGPFHGKTRIVSLDPDGAPPSSFRGRPSLRTLAGSAYLPGRHAYAATRSGSVPAGWTYSYTGADPETDA